MKDFNSTVVWWRESLAVGLPIRSSLPTLWRRRFVRLLFPPSFRQSERSLGHCITNRKSSPGCPTTDMKGRYKCRLVSYCYRINFRPKTWKRSLHLPPKRMLSEGVLLLMLAMALPFGAVIEQMNQKRSPKHKWDTVTILDSVSFLLVTLKMWKKNPLRSRRTDRIDFDWPHHWYHWNGP